MLGWLPAFVFVIMCVALDQSNAVAIHYGGIKGLLDKQLNCQYVFLCCTSCSFHIIQHTILCVDSKSYQEYKQTDTKSNSPNTEPQDRRRVFKDLHFDGLHLDFRDFKDCGVGIL